MIGGASSNTGAESVEAMTISDNALPDAATAATLLPLSTTQRGVKAIVHPPQ